LDLFCYEGWLACHAATVAEKVTAVDSSVAAIEMAGRNARLNGHKNIEFVCADAFEFLKGCGEKFDLVHIDPPPFAKGRESLASALKGYEKLCRAAFPLLKDGGILFISSCSHHVTERLLEDAVRRSAPAGSKTIYRGVQDSDHPVLKGFPESLYLKGVAVLTGERRLPIR